jgi:hypothetical protein
MQEELPVEKKCGSDELDCCSLVGEDSRWRKREVELEKESRGFIILFNVNKIE